MTKSGLAAVRELIAARFKDIHGDVRDEAQVRASREMLAEIEKPEGTPIDAIRKHVAEQFNKARQTPQPITEPTAQVEQNNPLNVRSKYLFHAALRSFHINSHPVLRRDLRECYLAETPTESAAELFAQALRQLGGK